MYIGKLGDGTSADDGIYILMTKEVLDNSIDEYMMGFGKTIDVTVGDDGRVSVRDYGRGIPLGKLVDVASKMNTGAKYDSKAFKKSVGLNGVGIKAVNALSSEFTIRSVRDGEARRAPCVSRQARRYRPRRPRAASATATARACVVRGRPERINRRVCLPHGVRRDDDPQLHRSERRADDPRQRAGFRVTSTACWTCSTRIWARSRSIRRFT